MICGHTNIYYIRGESQARIYSSLFEAQYLNVVFEELADLLCDDFSKYAFYVYSNSDPMYTLPLEAINDGRRKILIYLSDEISSVPRPLGDSFLAVFKCYLRGDCFHRNIFPLALGYSKHIPERPVVSMEQRGINVFFSGNLNTNRIKLYQELSGYSDYKFSPKEMDLLFQLASLLPMDFSAHYPESYIKFTNGFGRGLSGEEYSRRLYQSKIAICPGGFVSNETFRHFEAMRAGCAIISANLPDTFYYRGAPIFTVSAWNEMDTLVEWLLADCKKLKEAQMATRAWWDDVCSEKAMARYIFRTICDLNMSRAPGGAPG